MRFLFLFVLPLVAKSGVFGDADSTVIMLLLCLSLAALALELVSNRKKGRRRPSIIFSLSVCLVLYATQGGVLMYARFQAIMARTAQQMSEVHAELHSQQVAIAQAEHATTNASSAEGSGRGRGHHKKTLLEKGHGKGKKDAKAMNSKNKSLAEGQQMPANFGGHLALTEGKQMRTLSIVLPCAEERENALNTVDRFCMRTPEDQLAEIIAVDDGSNPPLKTLFEQDKRRLDQNPRCKLKILRHEVTTGLMAAKQTGGKAATGDVVAFFDCHCSPKIGWHIEILDQVSANPRRMVVPAITDLDLDTFDEKENSAVNAKCYLTFDADFKWFDDESDFIPTISGGLVAMGRQWFNMTGGFDEMMHGWGGENLDQSLRSWLCGGEITRAKSSRIAHMWRTGDHRTMTRYHIRAKPTNNRGRVATAWFDAFLPAYRGSKVPEEAVKNFEEVKKRLGCRPFSFFIYRFRKIYLESGVIAKKVFHLREKASGLCLSRGAGTTRAASCGDKKTDQELQLGNVDRETGKCCSGIRKYGANDCLDFMDGQGPHWYSCDVTGNNGNQQYRITPSGQLRRGANDCLYIDPAKKSLKQVACSSLADNGIFEKVFTFEPKEYKIYLQELDKHQYSEIFPNLPDN